MKKQRIGIRTAIAAAALVALASGCALPEDTTDDKPKKELGETDITVGVKKILKEFEDNELAADEKYKGKVVEIKNGKVNKVDTELLNDKAYVLNIGSGGEYEFTTVNCTGLPKSTLASLKVGDKVRVAGEFKDGGDLGVDLENCAIR